MILIHYITTYTLHGSSITDYKSACPLMAVVKVQRALLDDDCSSSLVSEDFIDNFSMVAIAIAGHSIPCFTTVIDHIKRRVTGIPSVKAATMLNSWREKTSPTYYIMLWEKVNACITISSKTRDVPHCWKKCSSTTTVSSLETNFFRVVCLWRKLNLDHSPYKLK